MYASWRPAESAPLDLVWNGDAPLCRAANSAEMGRSTALRMRYTSLLVPGTSRSESRPLAIAHGRWPPLSRLGEAGPTPSRRFATEDMPVNLPGRGSRDRGGSGSRYAAAERRYAARRNPPRGRVKTRRHQWRGAP